MIVENIPTDSLKMKPTEQVFGLCLSNKGKSERSKTLECESTSKTREGTAGITTHTLSGENPVSSSAFNTINALSS